MTNLFFTILNMSIAAGFAAMAVMAARLVLRRAPAVFAYLLWSAVAFRLIVPVQPASSFSILKPVQPLAAPDTGFMTFVSPEQTTPALEAGLREIHRIAEKAAPAAAPWISGSMLDLLIRLGTIIWMAGVIILLLAGAKSYWNIRNRIRTATRVRDHIYESDQIDTPFVFGMLKPRIYVPTGLGERELTSILLHEQAHIDRRDHLVKPLAWLLLVLHWFNPLMWLSYTLMSKDMEMSCDERVMNKADSRFKRQYAAALLAYSVRKSGLRAGNLLGFGESHVTTRIRRILAYRRPSARAAAGYMLVIAVLIAACSTNPKAAPVTTHPGTQTFYAGYDLNRLMDNKTLYVGNASKVGGLIQAMPVPEGLTWNGIELQTVEPPYGVTIRYQMNDAASTPGIEDLANETFRRQAILLLSLIDNVDRITYTVDMPEGAGGSAVFHVQLTREQAESLLGEDVRPYSADESGLRQLIDQVNGLSFAGPPL